MAESAEPNVTVINYPPQRTTTSEPKTKGRKQSEQMRLERIST